MRMLATLLCFSAVAQATGLAEPVDLNAPGALGSLQQRRPDHYAKVQAILGLVQRKPQLDLGPWIEARFDASNVDFQPLWRASDPPKVKISFTLDNDRYTAVVAPELQPARAMRARQDAPHMLPARASPDGRQAQASE